MAYLCKQGCEACRQPALGLQIFVTNTAGSTEVPTDAQTPDTCMSKGNPSETEVLDLMLEECRAQMRRSNYSQESSLVLTTLGFFNKADSCKVKRTTLGLAWGINRRGGGGRGGTHPVHKRCSRSH